MTNATNIESLKVERIVPASPDHVFQAWTDAEILKKWWGPKDVKCLSARIDLRVGGQYRIANELPDRTVLWISGEFEVIDRPHLLVYTWIVENTSPNIERVRIRFEPIALGTKVVLTHELIATKAISEQHRHGWIGCLDGLVKYLA